MINITLQMLYKFDKSSKTYGWIIWRKCD